MGPFKTCVIQERDEGRLTKNVTKSDLREGFAAKKCDVTRSKKNKILGVKFFLNGPYDDVLLCCIFYEFLVDSVIRFL